MNTSRDVIKLFVCVEDAHNLLLIVDTPTRTLLQMASVCACASDKFHSVPSLNMILVKGRGARSRILGLDESVRG